LSRDKKTIRKRLDAVIANKIEQEQFKFPISQDFKVDVDPAFVNDDAKIDIDDLFNGNIKLPDIHALDVVSRLILCMRVCAKFVEYIDGDPSSQGIRCKQLHNMICQFDDATAILSMRAQIGLECMVSRYIDVDESMYPYMRRLDELLKD
jgi:hypothetical protein